MAASDDWAHQTSMQRGTGSDVAMPNTPYSAQLQAQSTRARLESQTEPLIAGGVTKLNDVVAGVLGGLA